MGTNFLARPVGEGRFRLDIRKKLFTMRKKFFTTRMVKHRNRFPRVVVEAPSLEIFKARLDRALRNPTELKMSLLTAGVVGLDDL